VSDVLDRLSAALADRYRIERELGQGGMATVYLAHDLRHDRKVAVKVLRPELASILGGERFLAEIKTTANLQHPHILSLFDSGDADGQVFYVMPLVEGESLRDRLTRQKQLPVDEAVGIAREVADALAYAHSHGVVHRDIKPENILLHGGHALVADFGIALAASRSEGATRMTETGMSLGTPHYMAPEQAMGERDITPKADIYALGCVLYEMLVGEPPFTGPSAQAIIARVMTEQPRSLTLQRHTIPPHVEAAVFTALEKLPADRFATAAQFAEALARPGALTAAATAARPAPVRAGAHAARLKDPLVVGLAAVAVLALGFALVRGRRPSAAPATGAIRFRYAGSDSARVVENFPWPAAISPDGSMLVYAAAQPTGTGILFAKRTDQLEGHPVPGTESGSQPLFSPDGQWVAFEQGTKEKKVRLDGSAPVTIADGGADNGADWTTTNELVLGSTGTVHGLSHVSVAGGTPTQLTRPDSAKGELDHLWPIASPDGRTIVFTIWSGALATAQLGITSLDDGKVTPLGIPGIRPLAVLDGALIYVQADGAVMAVPLNARGRRVSGKPVPVLDPVPVGAANNGNSDVFVSRGGGLVTAMGTHRAQLTWIGRNGAQQTISPEVRDFVAPRLSPDGRRIAVIVVDGAKSDVWVYELATGTLSRLTTVETVTSVEWTHDGSRVVYTAAGAGGQARAAVWAQQVGVAAPPEKLAEVSALSPYADISPDRRSLLLQSLLENSWGIERIALDSGGSARPYSVARSNAYGPRFSPDGRRSALTSDESGTFETYVRSFPDPTVKLQVSVGGGGGPVWSADGARLYYISGTTIVEARLSSAPDLRVVARDTAFKGIRDGVAAFGANYDVTRDGSRIVIPVSRSASFQLVVVPNWLTEFREKMAANKN
jgi:serine/threonine-protein kinase